MINEKRWEVEGVDKEVVHRAVGNHHLALISRPLLRPWVLQLLPLHRIVQLGVKGGQVTSNGL